MKKCLILQPVILLLIICISCVIWMNDDVFYFDTDYESFVVNLSGVNTEYDDYNTIPLTLRYQPSKFPYSFDIIFSTNRKSFGRDYDVFQAQVIIDKEKDKIKIKSKMTGEYASVLNSSTDELGPFLYQDTDSELYFFTSNRAESAGGLDVFFSDSLNNSLNSVFFNTIHDDGYISIVNNFVYFCSDRDGNFDIFQIEKTTASSFSDWLTSKDNYHAEKIFSTDYNEKCPYIVLDHEKKIMVFASDRQDITNYGKFDIYITSENENSFAGNENDLNNIGSIINTAYNEYRPSLFIIDDPHFKSNVFIIIFSSDRPGGKGGYDLYLAFLI